MPALSRSGPLPPRPSLFCPSNDTYAVDDAVACNEVIPLNRVRASVGR